MFQGAMHRRVDGTNFCYVLKTEKHNLGPTLGVVAALFCMFEDVVRRGVK